MDSFTFSVISCSGLSFFSVCILNSVYQSICNTSSSILNIKSSQGKNCKPIVSCQIYIFIIYIYIYIQLIGLVGRVFANGPEDLGSIPDHLIPKTLKVVAIEKGAFWSTFFLSLTGLNSEFYFSWTSCYTKVTEPNLPYYLPIFGGRIVKCIPFLSVLA